MTRHFDVGDIIRYTAPIWDRRAVSKHTKAVREGFRGGFSRRDRRGTREVIGTVERMTEKTVWIRPIRPLNGAPIRARIGKILDSRGFENRSRMAERAGWWIDHTTGEVGKTDELIAKERAGEEVKRWTETIRVYGEAKARYIAEGHLGGDAIIDRILKRQVDRTEV